MQLELVNRNKYKWHRWFAWFPVIANYKLVWLETVYRKKVESFLYDSYWVYRTVSEHQAIKDKAAKVVEGLYTLSQNGGQDVV